MKRSKRVTLFILSALVVATIALAGWTRVRSPESSASADSYRLWIAMIKGFHGEVRYVGSDGANVYFRLGRIFWSYYKIPLCAAQLPETFSVRSGRSYVVRQHVGPGNTINIEDTCAKWEGYKLGRLDRREQSDA